MAQHPKKLLIISSEFPPNAGGIGNHAFNLSRQLAEEGYEVTAIADIQDIQEKELKQFITALNFFFFPIKRKKIIIIIYLNRLFYSLKLSRINNIVIVSGKFSLWLVNLLRLFFPSKKIISVVHGTELNTMQNYSRALVNEGLKKSNAIIAVSGFTKKLLPRNIAATKEIKVIPNGILLQEFVHAEKKKTPIQDEIKLVTLGSVTERKGQENIINALPLILEKFPDTKYHIIGKPLLQRHLEKIAKSNGTLDKIIFYGMVDRDKLISILSNCHIKMMLSINSSSGDVEGFGIAVLEGNALGLPAIGSKNTGLEDAIKDGYSGRLVDPKNPKEIVEAIDDIVNNYATYSLNALNHAKEYDWSNVVKKYIDVIQFV